MANTTEVQRRSPGTIWHLLGSLALLVGIAWAGLRVADRAHAWVMVLVMMVAFIVLNGHGITGYRWGALVDSRNRMSLSRVQMVAWTLVILSALATAVLSNVARGSDSPMQITIPPELWVLMGISTAAAVGTPLLQGNKRSVPADMTELKKTAEQMQQQGHAEPDLADGSILLRNLRIEDARFSELLKGDEAGNGSTIDLGKLQMFFFTFTLVCGYGAAMYTMFQREGLIAGFPPVEQGMNVLLGISQTGYLSSKAMNVSKKAPEDAAAGGDAPKT